MAFNFEEALSGFKTEAGRYSRRLKSASVPEGLSARTAVNHNSALMSAHRATTGVLSQVMDAKYAPYAAAGVLGAGALAANNLAGNFAYNHPMARVPVAGLKLAGLGAAILDPALMPSLLRSGIKAGAQTVGRAAEKTNAAGFANVGKTLENKARTLRPPVAIEASAVVAKAQAEAPAIVLKPSQTPTRVVSDSEQISAGFDARETAAASSRSMDHASGVESRQNGYEEKKSQRASAPPASLTPTFPPQHSLTPSVQEPLTVEKFDEAMAAHASPRPGDSYRTRTYASSRTHTLLRAECSCPSCMRARQR